jgi:adenosylmethionine-8-amino-7-oxononanoate aminotransferase
LTGGYLPLAATLMTEEIYTAFLGRYDEFKAFFHGHSYTANPLGCAAGLATLSIFAREDVPGHVAKLSGIMGEELARLKSCRWCGDIRQRGLMSGIEIVEDRGAKTSFPPERKIGQRVIADLRKRGIILRPLGDVIVLMPPLSSTADEIVNLVAAAGDAIDAVLSGKG